MRVQNGGPNVQVEEAVLFPFDDQCMPFRYRLQVGLVPGTNPYSGHERVLETGPSGSADHLGIAFYGTVIRVDGQFRMWYRAQGDDNGVVGYRMAYAVSDDGINWEKPSLGLTSFNSSTDNNLVALDSEYRSEMNAILVLHDPEDPDLDRRFKLINEVSPFFNIAAFSPDGLRWTMSPHNPILKHNTVEPGGIMKFDGAYYLTGQGGNVGSKRALVTYMSYDFEQWTDGVAVGLRRDRPPYRQLPGPHAGEQVHLGASLWNRGNVILGVYGQWHGESNDRAFLSMDLGLVVSNDGLHYAEPVPDFPIISAYEINPNAGGGMVPMPCLEQGQGFENVGDETFIYYAPWRDNCHGSFVCVARWPRDRLGYAQVVPDPSPDLLTPDDTHSMFWARHIDVPIDQTDPHMVSCPIQLENPDCHLFVNADGLSEQAELLVEILDQQFRPVPGYAGSDSIPLTESGLRQMVTWRSGPRLAGLDQPIRIKVTWTGSRQDANLFAVYLSETEQHDDNQIDPPNTEAR